MAAERNDFILGVGADTSGIRRYLRELEVLPQSLSRISREINRVQLGDGRKFEGDGRAVARALVSAFRTELGGGKFTRAFNEATRGMVMSVPESARSQLRRDLRAISEEIRRALPQTVRVGVRAQSDLSQLPTQAELRQPVQPSQTPKRKPSQQQTPTTSAPAEGVDPAAARAEATRLRESQRDARRRAAAPPPTPTPVPLPAETINPAVARAEAARLRQQRKQQEQDAVAAGATPQRRVDVEGSGNGLSPAELLNSSGGSDRRSPRFQAAARRLSAATAGGAIPLERAATREETRAVHDDVFQAEHGKSRDQLLAERTERRRYDTAEAELRLEEIQAEKRQQQAQRAGQTEARAYRDDEGRAVRHQQAAQRAGQTQERAFREDESRAARQQSQAQTAGRTQIRATKENDLRDRLSDPSSEDALLARASREARARRAGAQRVYEQQYPDSTVRANQDLLSEGAASRRRARIAEEERRLQSSESRFGSGLGGFTGSFQGMFGNTQTMGRIFGASANFFAAAQAMQLVMSAITEVVHGTLDFEKALGGLSVTFDTGKGDLRGFATEVGGLANNIGLTQAQGVEAASQSVGLFNTSGLSQQDKQDFAKTAVEVTGRVAEQSGKTDLSGVESNLAGILRSFQMQNSELTSVEDAITVISKRTGANAADILDAGAQVALLAHEAGFNAYQTSAIIANQSTTTGQSAQTAGELLAQVFAQATNPTVQKKFQALGVKTEGTSLKEELDQLSEMLRSGRITERNLADLSSAFGRSRGGAALIAMVQQNSRINSLATEAQSDPGAGKEQFKKLTDTITFQIKQMIGSFRNLSTELAQSGVFDFIAALVPALRLTAEALTEVLKLFNEIPRPLRSVAFGLTELALAIAMFGKMRGAATLVEGFAAGMSGIGTRLVASRAGQGLLTNTVAASVAPGIAGRAAAAGASASAASATAGGAGTTASLITNPVVIAAAIGVAGIIAAQKVDETRRTAERAQTKATLSSGDAKTAGELRAAAADRRAAADAQQARRDQFWGLGGLMDSAQGGGVSKLVQGNKDAAAALDERAKAMDASEKAATSAAGGFGRFTSAEEVTAQLQNLDVAGYSAAEQVAKLSASFDRVAAAAASGSKAVILQGEQGKFGQEAATGLTKGIGTAVERADAAKQAAVPFADQGFFSSRIGAVGSLLSGNGAGDMDSYNKYQDAKKKLTGLDQGKVQGELSSLVQGALKKRGKDASQGDVALTDEDLKAVNDAISQYFDQQIAPQLQGVPDDIKQAIKSAIKLNSKNLAKDFKPAQLDAAQIFDNFLDPLMAKISDQFSFESKFDKGAASGTRVKEMRTGLGKAQTQVDHMLDGMTPEQITTAKNDSESPYSKALVKMSAAQRTLDEALLDDAQIQNDGVNALVKLRQSRKGVLDTAGRAQSNIAILKNNVFTAKDPIEKQKALAELEDAQAQERLKGLDRSASHRKVGVDVRDTAGLAAVATRNAQERLDFARREGDQQAIDDALVARAEARQAEAQTLLGIRSSKRLAGVQVGDAVGAAQAALSNAMDEQGAALKGTQAYYDTIAKVAQTRKQVADALLARQKLTGLLSIDLTDPVAQAQQEVLAARRALAAAKGPDDKQQARLDLKNAQNAAEATKFNQRLSDVQTADELGRISHESYLRYLNNEHDRLAAISNRTRQQQDELDQIDKLIKTANDSLSGQFNLGDIKLPTIYQVRRSMQGGAGSIMENNNGFAGAGAGQVINDSSQRSITLNGVPIEEVMKRIQELYGGATVSSSAGRRV